MGDGGWWGVDGCGRGVRWCVLWSGSVVKSGGVVFC